MLCLTIRYSNSLYLPEPTAAPCTALFGYPHSGGGRNTCSIENQFAVLTMSAVPEVLRTTVSFTQHDIDSITIDSRSEVIFAYPQRTEDGYFF